MKLYFVEISGEYGYGGMVVCAESEKQAVELATAELPNGFWKPSVRDVSEIDASTSGVLKMAYYME